MLLYAGRKTKGVPPREEKRQEKEARRRGGQRGGHGPRHGQDDGLWGLRGESQEQLKRYSFFF